MLKFLRVYWSKNPFRWGSIQPEVVRSAPLTGAGARLSQRRQESQARKLYDGCRSSGCLIWESLVAYLCLAVLRFCNLKIETLTGLVCVQ